MKLRVLLAIALVGLVAAGGATTSRAIAMRSFPSSQQRCAGSVSTMA